jgi:hypothetical protein
MSNQSMEKEMMGAILGVITLGMVLLIIFSLFWLAIPVGIIVACFVLYRIYQNSDEVQERKARALTYQLFEDTKALRPAIPTQEEFTQKVNNAFSGLKSTSLREALIEATLAIYEQEGFDVASPLPPPTVCRSIEGARYRDYLAEYGQKAAIPDIGDRAANLLIESFTGFTDRLPILPDDDGPYFSISLEVFAKGKLPALISALILPVVEDEAVNAGLFLDIRRQMDENICELSGLAPVPENFNSPDVVSLDDYDGDDIIYDYFKDTPFLDIFKATSIPFSIPDKARFEHGWILAPQGTGKAQLIQFLVSADLERVRRDEASIVVMDSQGDLIDQISSLAVFAPGGSLEDKLVVLAPDLEYPLALNIFDLGRDRLKSYSARDREQLTNSTIDLLTYVFDALLGEGGMMTTKQSTIYRYIIRLLMEMPNATLATFADVLNVLKPEELEPYQAYINKLNAPAQDFFKIQYCNKQFNDTKAQVAWRLATMMENTVFERMFSHPKSKLDLFEELNSSKVILINTDKSLLGEDRTAVFGRFFIAMLLAAAQERSTLTRLNRLPVFCYIDEAQDYIATDTKITRILDQARKMNISMMLAHQRTKQISVPNVLDALATTSVKFASTDNHHDAFLLAKSMNSTADFIAHQPERHFALHIRRQTEEAISVDVPFFVMENAEHMNKEERLQVRDRMRRSYSSEYSSPSSSRDKDDHQTVPRDNADVIYAPDLSEGASATTDADTPEETTESEDDGSEKQGQQTDVPSDLPKKEKVNSADSSTDPADW